MKLIEGKVSVYVRRAGPNYQEGLRIMRELGKYFQPSSLLHKYFNFYKLKLFIRLLIVCTDVIPLFSFLVLSEQFYIFIYLTFTLWRI